MTVLHPRPGPIGWILKTGSQVLELSWISGSSQPETGEPKRTSARQLVRLASAASLAR